MNMDLSLYQTRVIGCLIEKEITTPDQYPLSLNALTLGCNQKSNRDPVLELTESDVQQTLDELSRKHMIREASGFGSRVAKFQHRFCNTEFGELQLTEQQLGILCVLFLRGPQTPGELRTRTQRLCQFSDVQEVEAVLELMSARVDGPLVLRLPREPGKRESRYAHLCSGEIETDTQSHTSNAVAQAEAEVSSEEAARLEALESVVTTLETEVVNLRQELAEVKAMLDELLA